MNHLKFRRCESGWSPRVTAVLWVVLWAVAPTVASTRPLESLFDEEWHYRLEQNPLLASSVGVHTYDHLLPDVSESARQQQARRWRGYLERLDAIEASGLSGTEQVNASLFRRQLQSFISEIEYGAWQMPITSEAGFHQSIARLPARTDFNTPEAYRNYIERLRALPAYFQQQVANMRKGLDRGWTQPRVVLEDYQQTALAHVVENPADSVFFAPFADLPQGWPESGALRGAGLETVRDQVIPAYRKLAAFFKDEYLPGARNTVGASALPDGEAWYQSRVAYFATYEISAQEIHRIGLAEVARIRNEMQAIIDALEFEGDMQAFMHHLRSDSRFYADTPDELLKEAAWIAKRMDAALPALFNHLPRLPYGIAPVPDAIAPRYTGGRYVPPPADSRAPGYYWVNTHDLPSRPLYTLPALTLHEAVPGHHLQHAIARELGQQPDFRRFDYISAYGEGWALYAERLGQQAGLYDDPYADFGRLTYEMWRACRLVVDTGLHLKGWSRAQVVDYLKRHTALSLHEINTETDRYISWPAQALSYKLGEIRIRALRDRARERLGDRFSLASFHDAVLGTGSVTLEILESAIDAFIAEQLTASPVSGP